MRDLHEKKSEPRLNQKQIWAGIDKGLAKYKKLNFLEHFGMFMGMAQLLEISLKNLAHRKYGIDETEMERWTLGWTSKELRKRGLRTDLCFFLDSVVKYRNHIAHSLLANEFMVRSLLKGKGGRFELRELEKGTIELEQLIFLFTWTEKHGVWDNIPAPRCGGEGGYGFARIPITVTQQ